MNADRFGSVHSTDICNDLVQHVQYSFSMLSGLFGTCQRRYWLPRCWHPLGRCFDGLGPSLAMAGSQCKATRGARCTHREGTDPRPEEERWRGDSLCLYIHHHRSTWSLLMRFRYFLFLIWGSILEFCADCFLEVPIASGLIRKGNREQARTVVCSKVLVADWICWLRQNISRFFQSFMQHAWPLHDWLLVWTARVNLVSPSAGTLVNQSKNLLHRIWYIWNILPEIMHSQRQDMWRTQPSSK